MIKRKYSISIKAILILTAVMILSGCVPEKLVRADDYPNVSPDGKWISYIFDRQNGGGDSPSGIYLVSIDGKEKIYLRDYAFPGSPIWSPNGKQLLLYNGIATLKANEIVDFREKADNKGMVDPCWSPDGKSILFTNYGNAHILISDTLFQQIRELPFGANMPKWMPDGAHILFSTQSAINITDTTGQNVIKLQNNTGKMSLFPVCSPDGAMIIWCTDTDAIYLMSSDGTNQRYLTEGTHPTWTPDSKFIVYSKSDNKKLYSYFLWKIGVDGNNNVQITK